MKFIDATWDTRNLGVRCAELEFARDSKVDAAAIDKAIAGFDYVAAKVDVPNAAAVDGIQRAGFRFVECSIDFDHDLVHIGNDRTREMSESVSHRKATDEQAILRRVGEGLFDTDRIFLDDHFTHAQAAQRYVNWLSDERQRGCDFYDVLFEGTPVGFFAYKEPQPHVSYPFLIGLYPEFRGKHLGASLIVESLHASLERGCVKSSTVVSSNNPAVIRCHESIGSYVGSMRYVFVRHSDWNIL